MPPPPPPNTTVVPPYSITDEAYPRITLDEPYTQLLEFRGIFGDFEDLYVFFWNFGILRDL
jgi:hypothetical protein